MRTGIEDANQPAFRSEHRSGAGHLAVSRPRLISGTRAATAFCHSAERRLYGHCGSLPSSGQLARDPIDLPSCTLESRSLALRENWTAAGMLCIGHQRRGIGNIVAGLPSAVVAGLPAGAVWIKPYRNDPMGFCLFNRSQPTIWRIQIFYRFFTVFSCLSYSPSAILAEES